MPEFQNAKNCTVHLPGPDGRVVELKSKQKRELPAFFERYVKRGLIIRTDQPRARTSFAESRLIRPTTPKVLRHARAKAVAAKQADDVEAKHKQARRNQLITKIRHSRPLQRKPTHRLVVGKQLQIDADEVFRTDLARSPFPVSNGIGVGILSYNRPNSLRRLLKSVEQYTDLGRTTVFISDDGSEPATKQYLASLNKNEFVVVSNPERLGIAGNTNRLLRCLSRFKHILLLNDDVEVLQPNWDRFYFSVMEVTGHHHFMYREPGVYGAEPGEPIDVRGITVLRTDERPHGAVLALTREALAKVGYFDERFGIYGMEHVDWSTRVSESGLQEPGFYDVGGAGSYFKIHSEPSVIADKGQHLRAAKDLFARDRIRGYIKPTDKSKVPTLSYVIPYRNVERTESIRTVIDNVRAQRFPAIQLILTEHDTEPRLDLAAYQPVQHCLSKAASGELFNKAKAFNSGVALAEAEYVVLHDADMLSQAVYSQRVYEALLSHEGCHLGGLVLYATPEATNAINSSRAVGSGVKFDRLVGYFEGGSVGCRRRTYWKVGAMNQDYIGYGCFTPWTRVLVEDGMIGIAEVQVGQKVLTHKGRFQPVLKKFERDYKGTIYRVYTDRDQFDGPTPEHPFWVQSAEGPIWKKAEELTGDDVLLGPSGEIFLFQMVPIPYEGKVLNLEVAEDNSYAVHGLFVHNCEDCDFYSRLAGGCNWLEDRVFDFLHLWHSRVAGWDDAHRRNRELERSLQQRPVPNRIALQHQQLRSVGYGPILDGSL